MPCRRSSERLCNSASSTDQGTKIGRRERSVLGEPGEGGTLRLPLTFAMECVKISADDTICQGNYTWLNRPKLLASSSNWLAARGCFGSGILPPAAFILKSYVGFTNEAS